MNNYIIINKDTIKSRIKELQKRRQIISLSSSEDIGNPLYFKEEKLLDSRIEELINVLRNSTPLIPEIKKAIDSGHMMYNPFKREEHIKEYISKLKLDI